MFKLSDKYQIDGIILKCDYIRYSSSKISTINTAISRIYINIPREDSFIFLIKSYFELLFDIFHAATNNRYVDGDDIWLFNLDIIALFNNFKLTTSSGKHLEFFDVAHIISLMYKLITSNGGRDDLSICFHRDWGRRQRELTNNKNVKRKYHVRIFIKHIFGLAEDMEKATYGLGYKLILPRNSDNAVLNRNNATAIGKIKINSLDWYVPQ